MDAWSPGRGRCTSILAGLAVGVGLLCAGAVATAEPPPDEATPMYSRNTVVVIDLTLPQASIEALEGDSEEYQPGTFSLAFTNGSPAGAGPATTPMEIGIRLKGGGSFRTLAAKAAFKLKLNYVKGRKFLGLKKMTLNNMVQDPSMIHEVLSYEVFRAAEVPAPRTGYAYVRLNGEDYGLYLNVETVDDVALERWFGPLDDPQHLYEGAYGTDVTPGGAGAFEVDEGDQDDRADLEALIAAVAATGSPLSERVGGLADLEEMTRMWAVERYIGHWDGYGGRGGPLFPNNFYFFSSATGEFQMLPWGTDLTWHERLEFDGEAGILFDQCMADPACRELYRNALIEVGETVEGLDLDSVVIETVALLEPWQQLAAPREEHGPDAIDAVVDEVREFVADRPLELSAWLNPSSLSDSLIDPAQGDAEGDGVVSRQAMRLERISIATGALTTQLAVPSAGQAYQRVEIRTANGPLSVCATQATASTAGPVTLRCGLSTAIQRRRRARWLRLGAETTFIAADGSLDSTFSRVHLRRASSR
jgi:hypothetical protein